MNDRLGHTILVEYAGTAPIALLDTSGAVFAVAIRLLGLGLFAAVVAGSVSFLFRWRTGTQLPEGPALLLGVGAVAVYLNTRIALVQFLGADGEVLTPEAVAINLGIFVVSTITAMAGWQAGDRFGQSDRFEYSLQPSLSPLVRATGRFITVELPDEIEDIDGYDPVSTATKDAVSGETYNFARGLTVEELEAALSTRLKVNHNVAHVDADLTDDGTVEFLALAGRASGIGPTLTPGNTATAITADPPFSASPGDTVQIWQEEERIGTAELRGKVGKTATVSGKERIIESLDPAVTYRLLTLPADERVDRLFAGMLRRADETMGITPITDGSTLTKLSVGDLGMTVVAIETADGEMETLPVGERDIKAGEKLYILGDPAQLRRIETAATTSEPYEPPSNPQKAADPGGRLRRLRGRLRWG